MPFPLRWTAPQFKPLLGRRVSDDEQDALAKPLPGAYRLEQRASKRQLRADEKQAKEAAKARDGKRCRAPHATILEYLDCGRLRIEAAHWTHKQMGGNPAGDRNVTANLYTLGLRCHRDRFDKELLRPRPLTKDGANGVVAWEEKRGDRWFVTHVEKRIGDANDRWRRRR